MNLLKLNIFKVGVFKQIGYFVSSPVEAQHAYYISESGTISQAILPIHTGFMSPSLVKKAWLVIHSLKYTVHKDGVATGNQILLISDRSYIPLDPNNTISEVDKEKLTSLKDIARLEHAGARADVGTHVHSENPLSERIIFWCLSLIGIIALLAFAVQNCGGPK